MSLAPSSLILPHRRLNAIIARWGALIVFVCNPYRPELHYMRGPGPKWHAKHQATHHSWLARRA
jgi:hypothetical protein